MRAQLKITFTLGVIILSISTYAQIDSFDMSGYYLPDYDRKGLEFKINVNNSLQNNRFRNGDGDVIENELFNMDQYIDSKYQRTINLERLQAIRSYHAGISNYILNTSNDNSDLQTSRSLTLRAWLDAEHINRLYIKQNYYLEISPAFSYSYTLNRTSDNYLEEPDILPDSRVKNNQNRIYFATDIRLGKGRIEPIEDARQLIYILSELRDANRLVREPDPEEMMEIAHEISRIKNKRFLDFRIRRKEELVYVDSVLQSYNLITENDALYFVTLNDYWSFADLPDRSSGYRFSVGFEPGLDFVRDWEYTKTFSKTTPDVWEFETLNLNYTVPLDFSVRYENSRPVSLNSQRYYMLEAYYILEFTMPRIIIPSLWDVPEKLKKEYYSITGKYDYFWYPNSRSRIGMQNQLNAFYDRTFNYDGEFISGDLRYTLILSGQGYYFISPQVSIQGSAGYILGSTTRDTERILKLSGYDSLNSRFYFMVSFNYKIF